LITVILKGVFRLDNIINWEFEPNIWFLPFLFFFPFFLFFPVFFLPVLFPFFLFLKLQAFSTPKI